MTNQEIVDYVINTPNNTNPVILKQMLKDIAGSGNLQLDTTLSIAGKAADAKAVGDAISKLSGGNGDYDEEIYIGVCSTQSAFQNTENPNLIELNINDGLYNKLYSALQTKGNPKVLFIYDFVYGNFRMRHNFESYACEVQGYDKTILVSGFVSTGSQPCIFTISITPGEASVYPRLHVIV